MVNTADSGERAIQVIESSLKIPDILVVDQNMYSSGGSLLGHEVVQKLRENSAFSDMIIIGCTAYADEARKHFFEVIYFYLFICLFIYSFVYFFMYLFMYHIVLFKSKQLYVEFSSV